MPKAQQIIGIRLLVVDDDRLLAKGCDATSSWRGFEVETVSDGETALARIAEVSPPFDMVVLDIMLPGMDGLEVFRRLRTFNTDLPVLFLTARGSDADRLIGLRLGADDYLTKPFLVEELVLRTRGILRRSAWSRTPSSTGPNVTIGLCTADLEQLTASTPAGTVHLTDRETMLLRFLAENDGRVLSRGELLERVWGYSFDTATRTLDTFIHRLRKHFEPDPQSPRHFHTVRGVGYRFTSEPEESSS